VQRVLLSPDLLLRILSYGFSNAYMLCGAWATVCSAWHTAIVAQPHHCSTSNARLWEAVSRHTWHLPSELRVSNWWLFYKRRACTLPALVRQSEDEQKQAIEQLSTAPLPIENCEVALMYVDSHALRCAACFASLICCLCRCREYVDHPPAAPASVSTTKPTKHALIEIDAPSASASSALSAVDSKAFGLPAGLQWRKKCPISLDKLSRTSEVGVDMCSVCQKKVTLHTTLSCLHRPIISDVICRFI
jgi:hypothetical protein